MIYQAYTIRVHAGPDRWQHLPVVGRVRGSLGLRSVPWTSGEGRAWVVDHLPTGRTLGIAFDSEREALSFVADWGAAPGVDSEEREVAREALRVARDGALQRPGVVLARTDESRAEVIE